MAASKFAEKTGKVLENCRILFRDKREQIINSYDKAVKGQEALDKTIQVLDKIAIKIQDKNLDRAREIYKNELPGLNGMKRSVDIDKLNKFLNDKNVVLQTLEKLKKAKVVIDKGMKPLKRVVELYEKAAQTADKMEKIKDLIEFSKKLSSADDFRRYNLQVARFFGEMSTVMKGMTGELPPIMREYCDYVLSAGENIEKIAKMVSTYTERLLKSIEEAEAEWRKVFNGRTTNAASGSEAVKLGPDHSLEGILNLFE